MSKTEQAASTEEPKRVFHIHYQKTGQYHEFACEGALGGVTPKGKIWMAFYSERLALPRVVTFAASAGSEPNTVEVDEKKKPLQIDSKEGIIRNVEASAYFSLDVAKAVRDWLNERISQCESETSPQAGSK